MRTKQQGVQGVKTVVPLASIRPWPGNPRKTFEGIEELAASIKQDGLLYPLLVRPTGKCRNGTVIPKGTREKKPLSPGQLYELADGERRFRAAKLAGLKEVPVEIKELTDAQMLQYALTTREHSRDLDPAEKSAAYQRLVADHGGDAGAAAAAVGLAVSTLRGHLRLKDLPEIGVAALRAGVLPTSHAQLIAAVGGTQARRLVALSVLSGAWLEPDDDLDQVEIDVLKGLDGGRCEALSFRETKDLIGQRYQRQLKGAPFSQQDAALLPEAGPCTTCPKRAGNAPEAFPGARADVCTDLDCYRRKAEAHAQRLKAAAAERGQKILSGKEGAALFGYWGQLNHDAPYVEAEGTCYDDPKHRPFRKLVGKAMKGEEVLAEDGAGNMHVLLPKAKVLEILKRDHGIGKNGSSRSSSAEQTRWRRQQQEAAKKAKAGKAVARKANGVVSEAVEGAAALAVGWSPQAGALLRTLAAAVAEVCWSDACRQVVKRRGLVSDDHRDAVKRLALSQTRASESLGLVAELVAAKLSLDWGSQYGGHGVGDHKDFWRAFGLDPAALLKEALAEKEAKAEKKGANGKAANGKAANGKAPPATPAGPKLLSREQYLPDLLTGKDVQEATQALEAAGLMTVGDLLDQAKAAGGCYNVLRGVKGLDRAHMLEVGDAVTDSGLLAGVGQELPA